MPQPITLLYGFHSALARQPLTELAVSKVTNDCLKCQKSKCHSVRVSRALKAVVITPPHCVDLYSETQISLLAASSPQVGLERLVFLGAGITGMHYHA